MSDTKVFTIDDIEREVTSDSLNTGYGFGTMSRIPHVEAQSDTMERRCRNDACAGREVAFTHTVSTRGTTSRSYNDVAFDIEGADLNRFEVEGEYCPICSRLSLRIDGEVVREREGDDMGV